MEIAGSRVLVLGGPGLVGMAVSRALLPRRPPEVRIHGLGREEVEAAREELLPEAGDTLLSVSSGDIFGLAEEAPRRQRIWAQIGGLREEDLDAFRLYRLLAEFRPAIVVDCVNTATAIAYRDVFRASMDLWRQLGESGTAPAEGEALLEALYVPRLIRHLQVLYRGLQEAGTRIYLKVGTTGTGGMGLNVPYTHSEERPSRVLLSKTAVAGAHSMLLFLMARTPGAPITKEIKPAAVIAWKRLGHGPIRRRGEPLRLVEARPVPFGPTFSSVDPTAARETERPLEAAFLDSGENGIFSLEEFAMVTSAEQMEFVTPEEIAQQVLLEIEGANTGHDVIDALDHAVLGPSYRAGVMRHRALERLNELQRQHGTRSVAFEMLGPPRVSKLLCEAHLLREAFGTMERVGAATVDEVVQGLDRLARTRPDATAPILAVGLPILLASGDLLRGVRVLVPPDAENLPVTPERLDSWVDSGWVDLRPASCARWIERIRRIREEASSLPGADTSSRHLRTPAYWEEEKGILPGKVVAWILAVEEGGARLKR